jgi:hypothetical protein
MALRGRVEPGRTSGDVVTDMKLEADCELEPRPPFLGTDPTGAAGALGEGWTGSAKIAYRALRNRREGASLSKGPTEPRAPRLYDDDVDADDADVPIVNASCHVCGISAPPTRSAHTLISSRHGWRLLRGERDAGAGRIQWICAKCWRARAPDR